MPGAIGTIAGGLVGGLMGGDDGGGQQVSKDPWGPAQQPLKDTLSELRALQLYQQQNPWNVLQQTGMQNTFTDLDAFRGQNNSLMGMANRLMGSNYSRGMPVQSGGLLSQPMAQQGQQMPQMGLLSIPQGQAYGQLNWKELNPYTATGGLSVAKAPAPAPAPTQEQLAKEEWERLVRSGMGYQGSGA